MSTKTNIEKLESSPSYSEISITPKQERWILFLIGAVIFASAVNASMINVALPTIQKHFGVDEELASWIVTAYALTFGIFNAINGRLSDLIGRRRIYFIGITILGATSILNAYSNHIELTIASRLLQGVGSATLPSVGSAIIAEVVPRERRGAAMGVVMSTAGFGLSIGPFIGGILAQYVSWRAVFACTSAALLTLPIAYKVLPKELNEPHTHSFDYFGALLITITVSTFFFAIHLFKLNGFSADTITCLSVSIFFLMCFTVWILKVKRPFIPPEVMSDIRYVSTVLIGGFVNATRYGTLVLVPIFLSKLNGYTPFQSALVLFPGALAVAFLSRFFGRFCDDHGLRIPVIFGLTLVVGGTYISGFYAGDTPWMVGVGMGLYGIGFAAIQTPLESYISHIMPTRLISIGLGFFLMVFFISGACGVVVATNSVGLQPADATSWLGLSLPDPRYSNAIILLNFLGVAGFLLIPFLPTKDSEPIIE